MSMTPRERLMAVLNGDEPDHIPVYTYYNYHIRNATPGGWFRRLSKRGLGAFDHARFYTSLGGWYEGFNPYLPDVKYTQVHYIEHGIRKYRHILETPVGNITGVQAINPAEVSTVYIEHTEEFFVKQPSDWRVVNYISSALLDNLAPNYQIVELKLDELGDSGCVIGIIEKTPWQKAWTMWAGPERSIVDFHEQPEELQEYIEIQNHLHARIAEFASESPCKLIDISDNITNMVSPKQYREYCLPIYKMYSKQLEGTGKILAIHMDGRFGHLKKEIAETPFNVIESYTVPPAGDVSLGEARKLWPDKMVIMNFAPHLHWADSKEVREGYEALAEEWGSKKGLAINRSESVPLVKFEEHISACMDAFGYP